MNKSPDLREQLSNLSHEIWSHWMRYMFSRCQPNEEEGTLTIPAWAVQRWGRQLDTPYNELTEEEKNSDREQADKITKLLGEYFLPVVTELPD